MNCREATLVAQKKIEGKVSTSEQLGLWLHLAMCSLCRLFNQQTELISKEAAKLNSPVLPIDAEKKEKMVELLKDKLKE